MKIKLAKTAGFCFGVNRAVELVNNLSGQGKKVYTLGPIIHNKQVVDELGKKGVRIADSVCDIEDDGTLVIRSHGVPQNVIREIKLRNIEYVDATCPFVEKIHKIVKRESEQGKPILIAGDKNHPEVQGIESYCVSEAHIFHDCEELEKILGDIPNLREKSVSVVFQTTFNTLEWEKSLKILKRVCTNATIFDTICNATSCRQSEAEILSKEVDFMVVIGGKHSSNTAKLKDICLRNCRTVLVETAEELPICEMQAAKKIGVTAGASTPANIIEEVLNTMSDALNNKETEMKEEELNFEAMLEESLKSLNTDDKVRGVVVGIAPNEIYVDVGRKQAGFVPLSELTNDSNARTDELVKIGDELELLIMKTNDQEGTIMLSKRRIDALKGWNDIEKAEKEKEVLTGKVTDIIKGGIIVVYNGIKVFIPASQATENRGDNLEELKNKEVNFRIIETNKHRRRAVGSIRSVLKDEKKKLAEKFWETAEVGKKYTGKVRSLTSYGAFVDLGGIDGMIHISELSWSRIKNPSEVVNVGDTVEVYIKDLDKESGRISLGYKRSEDNPWEIFKRDYPVGTIVEAKVVGMTTFGAFARILPGIDGLIHISQIANRRIDKPQDELSVGQTVKAIITDIDYDKKRISLSIRALLEADVPVEEDIEEAKIEE